MFVGIVKPVHLANKTVFLGMLFLKIFSGRHFFSPIKHHLGQPSLVRIILMIQ